MVDYLIVGLGLAGISFCERLDEKGKTFHVISDNSQTSSAVAAGLYNPVILKRFTLAWKANELLELAVPFYTALEKKLEVKLNHKLSVVRRFNSIEEQNLWFEATDKAVLSNFLATEIQFNKNPNIDAPYGFGAVLKTGRINTEKLLQCYSDYLVKKEILTKEKFEYNKLNVSSNSILYKGIKARNIVFAEGYGLVKNPFFKYLPLHGNKGEYVIIEAPDLQEEKAIKSSIFCIPLGENCYKIGANYNREELSNTPSLKTQNELLNKMKKFVKCDYKILSQVAGVRPTVVDRRPLIGQHPKHQKMFVLNGFGSRGVMLAPYASLVLYKFIEKSKALNNEIDCARFNKRYLKNSL